MFHAQNTSIPKCISRMGGRIFRNQYSRIIAQLRVLFSKRYFEGRTSCGCMELLLVLDWAPKLEVGKRSSACGKELLDGTSSNRSWSELSSINWKESSIRELLSGGNANRLLGLKQEPSLSTSSLCSQIPPFVTLLGILIVVFVSEKETMIIQCNFVRKSITVGYINPRHRKIPFPFMSKFLIQISES